MQTFRHTDQRALPRGWAGECIIGQAAHLLQSYMSRLYGIGRPLCGGRWGIDAAIFVRSPGTLSLYIFCCIICALCLLGRKAQLQHPVLQCANPLMRIMCHSIRRAATVQMPGIGGVG